MKQLKYGVKRACLARSPRLWWWVRRTLKGELEPEVDLLPVLCEPGRTFVDVGANWGAYAYLALRLGRSVHACEPQPALAEVLRRGLGPLGGTIHEVALSDSSARGTLRIPVNDIGYSTIESHNSLQDSADLTLGVRTVDVVTVRLDDLNLGNVALIKIDVEGHELAVLAGASAVLKRDTPSLIVETEDRHNEGTRGRVWAFLAALGYLAFWYQKGALLELARASETAARNLVFVHRDRVGSLSQRINVQRAA